MSGKVNSVDSPSGTPRINSIVGMILYMRQNSDRKDSLARTEYCLRNLLKELVAIAEDERGRKVYRRHKEGISTLLTTQMAVAGLICDATLTPKIVELACVVIGVLLRISPYESWRKNSREFLLRTLSLKLYNAKADEGANHQCILAALLCGRMVLGSLLFRKFNFKKKEKLLRSWIKSDEGIVNEESIYSVCCADEDIINSLRASFHTEVVPKDPSLEKEIYENALPLIVASIELVLNTKHRDLRSVSLDCIYSFISWLDSWSHFDASIPALSTTIANTLHSKRNLGYDCVVGCIRNIEVVVCRCLGDSVIHHLKDSPWKKDTTHSASPTPSSRSYFDKYKDNVVKICRIVSEFAKSDDPNVRLAVSNFLGSVCYNCSRIIEPYCSDAFSVIASLSKDADPRVAASSRENILTISSTRSLEKMISDKIYPLVESFPLTEHQDINSIVKTINSIDEMIEFAPKVISSRVNLFLDKVVLCIIDTSVCKDIELVSSSKALVSYDMGQDFILKRPKYAYDHAKARYTSFLGPLEKLLSKLAAADFSSFREIVELVSPFLEPESYSKRHQEAASCIMFHVLNGLKSCVDYDRESAIIDVMDTLYPVIAFDGVFRVVSGNYTKDAEKGAQPRCSPACVTNILNCINIACHILGESSQSALLPKWLYIALSKVNYTNDEVDIAAKNALFSIAKVSKPSQECSSPREAVEKLIFSYADYILNTSVSMLLQPEPPLEAFYLLFSTIRCYRHEQMKYLNNVLDEILVILGKSWCSNNDVFDILITIIDALSQKLLEICLGTSVQKVRGLIWGPGSGKMLSVAHSEGLRRSGGTMIANASAESEFAGGSLDIGEKFNGLYEASASLVSSCSPEVQEFYIKHAKSKIKVDSALNTSDVISSDNDNAAPQAENTSRDSQLYEEMALKILSVLHRYSGSYRVNTREAVLNSMSRLFSIFMRDTEKILPEIHKKWNNVLHRLFDKSLPVAHAAARCILVMCQLDTKFVTKRVNKDLIHSMIDVLKKSELDFRIQKNAIRERYRRTRAVKGEHLPQDASAEGRIATMKLFLSLSAEVTKLGLEISPENARLMVLLAFKLMNPANYTTDVSDYASNLIVAMLNAHSGYASDYAWMLSWVALGSTRCFHNPKDGIAELDIDIPSWLVQKHRDIIVPSAEHRHRLLTLLASKDTGEIKDSTENPPVHSKECRQIIACGDNVFWEIHPHSGLPYDNHECESRAASGPHHTALSARRTPNRSYR